MTSFSLTYLPGGPVYKYHHSGRRSSVITFMMMVLVVLVVMMQSSVLNIVKMTLPGCTESQSSQMLFCTFSFNVRQPNEVGFLRPVYGRHGLGDGRLGFLNQSVVVSVASRPLSAIPGSGLGRSRHVLWSVTGLPSWRGANINRESFAFWITQSKEASMSWF